MSDYALFSVVPLLALIVFTMAAALRLADRSSSIFLRPASSMAGRRRWCTRMSVAVIVLGHVVMIAWPAQLLSWIREPQRLLALEAVLVAAGVVAAGALVIAIRRRSRSTSGWSIGDVMFLSVLAIAITSGLALAIAHRWAAAWSVSTLTPYVRSVLSLQPDIGRLEGMPYLVRLHVVSAFLVVATLPFSTPFEVIRRAWARIRVVISPIVETMDRRWALAQEGALRRGRRLVWPEEED
jgi:nitrate reductase gamma subunit